MNFYLCIKKHHRAPQMAYTTDVHMPESQIPYLTYVEKLL